MSEKVTELREALVTKLSAISDMAELETIRVEYLGKNGLITGLLKGMKDLSIEEKKDFGGKVNELKNEDGELIAKKTEEIKEAQIKAELEKMPEIDLSMPIDLKQGSYHPITLVQRELEKIFKTMGFTVEDYSEVVTDYE